jgi:hypothetical protein
MLIKYLREFNVDEFANELIGNLDYMTDEEIMQLQYKAQQIKVICKVAIKYRKKSGDANARRQKRQLKKIEIASAVTLLNTDKLVHQ